MENFKFENFYGNDEKVIFKGQPSMATYPIGETFVFGMIFILVMLADGFMLGASVFKSISGESIVFEIVLFSVALVLHLIPIGYWGSVIVKKYYSTSKVYYLITDKRAVKIINDDKMKMECVELENVTDIRIIDNSLVFFVQNGKTVFKYIPEPQEIFNAIIAAFSGEEEQPAEAPAPKKEKSYYN